MRVRKPYSPIADGAIGDYIPKEGTVDWSPQQVPASVPFTITSAFGSSIYWSNACDVETIFTKLFIVRRWHLGISIPLLPCGKVKYIAKISAAKTSYSDWDLNSKLVLTYLCIIRNMILCTLHILMLKPVLISAWLHA